FAIEDQDIKTDTSAELKVIFDVSKSSEDKSVVNKYIETAARFLNMHANEGMSNDQLHVAMTIHGGAWQDVLDNDAYKEKYGVDNPNSKLIAQLNEAGVDIILCGQTASFRGMKKEHINPNVKMALSAMTALLQYQANGYKFIKF
ncbi:MAG: DsrE family protein, partial [Flavobacteriaceae bacterium]|nr:DsrE family protein [Flavobacteriaceae bacterium]